MGEGQGRAADVHRDKNFESGCVNRISGTRPWDQLLLFISLRKVRPKEWVRSRSFLVVLH